MNDWRSLLSESLSFPGSNLRVEDILAIDGPLPTPHAFAKAYEQARYPAEERRGRRSAGAYYTPATLMNPILEHSVLPTLTRRWSEGREDPLPPLDQWTASEIEQAEERLLDVRICDPACGPGLFLIAAGEMLAQRLVILRTRNAGFLPEEMIRARGDVARHCLFGFDIDPWTASAARAVISLWCQDPLLPRDRITAANALEVNLADRAANGWDVVIGNPPFANAIEKDSEAAIKLAKAKRSATFQDLGGTADLAYYFLALAHSWARPEGSVGLVLPRAFLSTPSIAGLRTRLLAERPPAMLFASPDPNLFPPANIFVAAVVLRASNTCLVGRPTLEAGDAIRWESVRIQRDNWWEAMVSTNELPPAEGCRVGDHFEVFASMTTGMAYDLAPFIREWSDMEAARIDAKQIRRLITTGLVEPGTCEWGSRVCRYLKKKYMRPAFVVSDEMSAYLQARLRSVARPKVIVAGLAVRIEAYLDATGNDAGAVSTFTMVDPEDNVERLARLCSYLNSPEPTARLFAELGATALGGGRITLSKTFLAGLAWQESEKAPPKSGEP